MNRTSIQCGPPCGSQRGAVLFVALVILLILSLLAIVTVNTSLMETKMAGGMRNMQLAQFAADSALNEAKVEISKAATAYGVAQVCAHLACAVRLANAPADAADFMQTAQARAAMIVFRIDFNALKGVDESAHLAASPAYVIEDLGNSQRVPGSSATTAAPRNHSFRITARGVGGTNNFVQVMESVYAIPD